jgi:hypothetical protein
MFLLYHPVFSSHLYILFFSSMCSYCSCERWAVLKRAVCNGTCGWTFGQRRLRCHRHTCRYGMHTISQVMVVTRTVIVRRDRQHGEQTPLSRTTLAFLRLPGALTY